MKKVKAVLLLAFTAALKPEFRPYEVRGARAVGAAVAAYLGYKGYKAS